MQGDLDRVGGSESVPQPPPPEAPPILAGGAVPGVRGAPTEAAQNCLPPAPGPCNVDLWGPILRLWAGWGSFPTEPSPTRVHCPHGHTCAHTHVGTHSPPPPTHTYTHTHTALGRREEREAQNERGIWEQGKGQSISLNCRFLLCGNPGENSTRPVGSLGGEIR